MEDKDKPKKEVWYLPTSRLVGGRFNKQENLHMRLVLGGARQVHLQTFPPEFLKFIQAQFILLGFTLLHFTDCVCVCVCFGGFFSQLEGLWQPCVKQVHGYHVSNIICPLAPLCHSLVILEKSVTLQGRTS